MTSLPFLSKKLALHPPQKSATQVALGWAGHFVTSQGFTRQFTGGLSGGHVGGSIGRRSFRNDTDFHPT